MKKISSGILLYRFSKEALEVFLVHPGGPFFTNKDKGVWSIPKGIVEENEELFLAGLRELEEETGIKVKGNGISLGHVERPDKIIYAFALPYQNKDLPKISSNFFKLEWPPSSGKICFFPEIDRGAFFLLPLAREKIQKIQEPFLERLLAYLEKQGSFFGLKKDFKDKQR